MIYLPWSEKNREWVGMDVNIVELMEEGEASSMPDTAEVSEEEGIYQNEDEQEDESSRSMGADLQENTGIEQPLASGEKLSEPEDSTIQNPLENIDQNKEISVPDDETRGVGENLTDPELAHVIVDEEVDFDQFGAPPPDLPLIDNLDNEQSGGIGSPNGEKGASGSTEVMKPEDQITDLDAENGFEQDMKNLNDGPVKTSLKETEEKEQLQLDRDPEPDVDPKSEDNEEYDIHRDLDTEPTAERNGTSELREPETVNPENIGDASSESSLRSLNIKTEVEGSSAQEEIQKPTEDLNQEQAIQLEDIHQDDLSNAQLEQSKTHEELKRKLEAECDERLKIEAKLMVLHEILPNMEEKLKNLSDQVQFLEVQLREQANSRNQLDNELQQERKEKTQYVTKLEEQTRLHEELAITLDEERDGRLKSEADLLVLREMFTSAEEKMKDLRDQVDSLVAQLQEETELRSSLEEKLDWESKERMQHMTKIEEQSKMHEELSLKIEEERDERLKSETHLKDLRDQVDSLVAQLQEETELRSSLEEKLDWECKERMQHMTKIEEQSKMHEELSLKIEEERDERLKSETHLKELRGSVSNKEEKLKDLHEQVVSLTLQLQEQKELKQELEGKWDHEREGRMQDAVTLPVSSMPWSEEKLEFEKLLDEQKILLANQVQEAEKLKNAAEMKVGLLNHQVQNLEVLTDIAETMESVFSAKERVFKQALWTVLQALCLGVGLLSFVVAYRDPLRSSLQPT